MNEAEPTRSGCPFVSVTGVIRGRFVGFEYTHGDPDLCVELIMPPDVFSQFCRERGLEVRASSKDACEAYAYLKRRHADLPRAEVVQQSESGTETRGPQA